MATLMMKLLGTDGTARTVGTEQLPGTANYFIGNDSEQWHGSVTMYRKVNQGLYPGIEHLFYSNQRELDYNSTQPRGQELHVGRNSEAKFHYPI